MKYNQIALLVSLISNICTAFSFYGLYKLEIYYMIPLLQSLIFPMISIIWISNNTARVYTILDSLGLSCLYSQKLNQDDHDDLKNEYLKWKYYATLCYLFIYSMTFLQIEAFDDSYEVDSFNILLFIPFSINLSSQCTFINFGKNQSDMKAFFMQASFYLSFFLFTQGKDLNGVYFIFYNLALILITIIYIVLRYYQYVDLSKIIIGCFLLNYEAQYYIFIQFICSMIRIIILLINIQTPYGQFGLNDFSNCEVLLYFTLKQIVQEEEELLLQDDTDQVLRFVDLIRKIQISKKPFIIEEYRFDPFFRYQYEILVNSSTIFEQLLQDLLSRNNNKLLEIFFKRCQVFQISNIISQIIFERVKNQISPQKRKYLNQIHALELQLNMFDKLIKPKLQFQPTLIFYDLYEDF
ncbi:hypothetical protein ABPG74_006810 [Tetrahymena malaccensis]